MRNSIIFLFVSVLVFSCSEKPSKEKFVVEGKLVNNTAKKIYLKEIPASTMQPMVVDSAEIGKDGTFTLKGNPRESVVFNLLFDNSIYPVVSVISDVPHISLDILLNKEDSQFPETYEVKGSPASLQLKNFVIDFNKDLQEMFHNSILIDSLSADGAPDSTLQSLQDEQRMFATKIRDYAIASFDKATDPALLMFELGYYQSMANGTGYRLQPLDNDHVMEIVGNGAKRFPDHQAVAAIHASLKQEYERTMASNWVGKDAPDFTLPDVNGKEVKLSSFRGKYVLVDFWASWCQPCRMENPNVVSAYQQYKNKNFTVLGVSLDRPGQKDKWIKAINDDQLTWTHVSDLQFWNSPIVSLYRFDGIPFNVLVNPEGKVIAQSLRGPGLDAKLAEVLN